MDKLAEQIPGILQESAQHMRKLSEANIELVQERDALAHELHVTKLARRMEQRGLEPGLSYEEKVSKLSSIPSEKLSSMEQAIELAAGGVHLGSFGAPNDPVEKRSGRTELYHKSKDGDVLDDFIMSQQAFGS